MPIHGTAGRGARNVVRKRAKWLTLYLIGAVLVFVVFLRLTVPSLWWLPFLLLPLALWRNRREMLGLFQPWIKGARGEEAVGRLLAELEPQGYRILHDIDTGRGNLDHVVVGPTGVFAIETKAWTGSVWVAKGRRLIRQGQDETGTIRQVMGEAMEVKRRINGVGVSAWVTGVVVL
ncbi:MAG TPA: nuclease-related domain-containing protein, partial [Actinomycetota bacterium]|nr:nuclease-related domain-containing protein [Actinomycetota bacterium]